MSKCCTDSTQTKLLAAINNTMSSFVDSETQVLCDPSTNNPVVIRYRFSLVNGTQTSLVYDMWNKDGTAYTGSITSLVKCGAQEASWLENTVAGAAGGVSTTGVKILDTSGSAVVSVFLYNSLDVDVKISLDGGSTYPIVLIHGTKDAIYLGAEERYTTDNIYAKAITSNSSSGSLYIGTMI